MICPFRSMRKHSVMALPPLTCISPDSRSIDLHARWRLASGDGRARAAFGATLAHTAWITDSKIGTTTWPPVEPPPSVRRLPPLVKPHEPSVIFVIGGADLAGHIGSEPRDAVAKETATLCWRRPKSVGRYGDREMLAQSRMSV